MSEHTCPVCGISDSRQIIHDPNKCDRCGYREGQSMEVTKPPEQVKRRQRNL